MEIWRPNTLLPYLADLKNSRYDKTKNLPQQNIVSISKNLQLMI